MSEQIECPYHGDIIRRITAVEEKVEKLEESGGGLALSTTRYEEQLKTLFRTIDEIKHLLEAQNVSFTSALAKVEANWTARFDILQKDVESIKSRPGRFADGALTAFIAGAGSHGAINAAGMVLDDFDQEGNLYDTLGN